MARDLSLVERGLTAIPMSECVKYAGTVTSLNLSENTFAAPGNLELFIKLDTLLLDHNKLVDLQRFPNMPTLRTLWFNNNCVNDMPNFLDTVRSVAPNLTYLSMMRNPAAPPLIPTSEEEVAAAKRYRLYVVYRLPGLQFLDSAPVTQAERLEAKAKGQYLAPRRPTAVVDGASGGIFSSSQTNEAEAGASASVSPTVRRPLAFLGMGGGQAYDGRHSEGNRFIRDSDL